MFLHLQIRFHIDRTFAAPHLSLTASRSRGRGLVFLPSAPAEDAAESPTSSGDLHRNSPKLTETDGLRSCFVIKRWALDALDALDALYECSKCWTVETWATAMNNSQDLNLKWELNLRSHYQSCGSCFHVSKDFITVGVQSSVLAFDFFEVTIS